MSTSAPPHNGNLSRLPNIVAFTGGKGGVGKTSIAVNLAIALARHGHRVCLLDGDTGLANVNILLGLQPQYSLEHLIRGERSLAEVLLEGPEGLKILPGASGVSRCAELDEGDQRRLVAALKSIEQQFDWVLVDTAAGIGSLTTTMVESAQLAAVIVTPEPTSLTDAFSLLKVLARKGYQRTPQVIVNMVRGSEQPHAIFRRFEAALNKYVGLDCDYLGSVWMDESLRQAVARQRPVATLPNTDPSCRLFMRLADSLASVFRRANYNDRDMSGYWLNKLNQTEGRSAPATQTKQLPSAAELIEWIRQQSWETEQSVNLAMELLSSIKAEELAEATVAEIKTTLRRLLGTEPNTPPPTTELCEPPSPEPVNTISLLNGSQCEPTVAGTYNRDRFGDQEKLLLSLKSLDNQTSLFEFLSQTQ